MKSHNAYVMLTANDNMTPEQMSVALHYLAERDYDGYDRLMHVWANIQCYKEDLKDV